MDFTRAYQPEKLDQEELLIVLELLLNEPEPADDEPTESAGFPRPS